ncbi:glycerol-3-phosphate dehydrogenase [Pontibacterium granulatum]|uniref:glycerol-3-phosphate dehydrogenase n=1 Tax=Pontibacterium granulatum TaxID=2036029 RepID=UPI00249B3658|nr:glycerol-3-phosphate dehydrogenase [Pontibacterium granulatum]MDI3322978.1 glycerol-3-phosphate dehydrogenase [Pontibacterium granulatum]
MQSDRPNYDLLVIGGGINGVGIAADAAGRGLSTLLCEMNDLGSATSSSSSKLIHGGLRYLEYGEFRLVREALAEREVLLHIAPHITRPLRFRLPHRPYLRPAWLIRLGLFLYDRLAARDTLQPFKSINFGKDSPLKADITHGFEYSDGWVDDARLVVLNAMAARDKGATILTHTRCISAQRQASNWQVSLLDKHSGATREVSAYALVNASGPWVSSLFPEVIHSQAPKQIRMVKGSHIVVPRLYNSPEAYILQNSDRRIVFVIPYEKRFSLIGTTDVEYHGEPNAVKISPEERDYLISVTNQHFRHQLKPSDIVMDYAGIRPLLDDQSDNAQAVTRDYSFEIDAPENHPPLISVFGGKITTYRKLAQAVVDTLTPFFPDIGPRWTANTPLPGGDFETATQLLHTLKTRYPWLPLNVALRYVQSYGTLCHVFLKDAHNLNALGTHFGYGLYSAEVDYLIDQEWAFSLEDILWRRSKLGLHLSTEQQTEVEQYLETHPTLTEKMG